MGGAGRTVAVWHRLGTAFGAVALSWIASLAVGALLATCLTPLSVDQPMGVETLAGWGRRWAVVMGVAIAMGATLGGPPPATLRRTAQVVGLTAAVVLGLSLVAGGLAVCALRLQMWGQAWGVPSRPGYAARLGVLAAAELVGLPSALWGGWCLLRERLQGSRKRSPGNGRGLGHG
jgi:hypothetical protein